jgi:hypothetical protein
MKCSLFPTHDHVAQFWIEMWILRKIVEEKVLYALDTIPVNQITKIYP